MSRWLAGSAAAGGKVPGFWPWPAYDPPIDVDRRRYDLVADDKPAAWAPFAERCQAGFAPVARLRAVSASAR